MLAAGDSVSCEGCRKTPALIEIFSDLMPLRFSPSGSVPEWDTESPAVILYIPFCMAELLQNIQHLVYIALTYNKTYGTLLN